MEGNNPYLSLELLEAICETPEEAKTIFEERKSSYEAAIQASGESP